MNESCTKGVRHGECRPDLNANGDRVSVDRVSETVADAGAEPRLIAFFLTQFHPTEENDAWWGMGFTEWTNVTKATPLFGDHYQPHLPTDLGFYDLRLKETRLAQIALAKQYGIDGFCYYYYWFSGKRILNKPLDAMLADPEHDMPFCLCWANENWTRRWDAADHEVLIAQRYLPDDDLNFIRELEPYFRDPRYIRHEGAPLLIVYRPQHLPDARKSVKIWRDYCNERGIGRIHVVAALTRGNEDYEQFGFDGGVEFPPHNLRSSNVNDVIEFDAPFYGNAMEYQAIAQSYLDREYAQGDVFRTVFPSWDNTARTQSRALVVLNGTPGNYEYWLDQTIRKTKERFPGQQRFVFINAWNEWAEGCHLEPDRRFGRGFLEATRQAKAGNTRLSEFPDTALPTSGALIKRSLVGDLAWVVRCHFAAFVGNTKTRLNRLPWARSLALAALHLARRVAHVFRA